MPLKNPIKRKPKVQSITSLPAKKPRTRKPAKPVDNLPTERQVSHMTSREFYKHVSGVQKSPVASIPDKRIKKYEDKFRKNEAKQAKTAAKTAKKSAKS